MTREPIRLEPWLSRDCIDRKEKMRAIQGKPYQTHINKLDLAACWVLFFGLVIWIWCAW